MWEWSYTPEAEGYAREQLEKFSRETLLEIAEEWKTKINEKAEDEYTQKEDDLEEGETLPPFEAPCTLDFSEVIKDDEGEMQVYTNSMLSDWIWEQAESWKHGRSCSNGGHEVYVCPHGCHCIDLRNMPKD
jgi:hypothetical protein